MVCNPPQGRRVDFTVSLSKRQPDCAKRDLTSVYRARLTASVPTDLPEVLAKAELISRITALGNDSEIEGIGLCSGVGISPAKLRAVVIKEREVCASMGRGELADRVIICDRRDWLES